MRSKCLISDGAYRSGLAVGDGSSIGCLVIARAVRREVEMEREISIDGRLYFERVLKRRARRRTVSDWKRRNLPDAVGEDAWERLVVDVSDHVK